MTNIGYYNGVTAPIEELTIPAADRAIYFGDGVYDFCICRDGVPYLLDEHVDRFFRSMSKIKIESDFSKEELRSVLLSLTKQVEGEITSLYWQASRGCAKRAHIFPNGAKPSLYATVNQAKLPDFSKPISCILRDDVRFLMCDVKTIDLLPSVLAAQEAEERGAAECILHRNGRVTECAHSNVSIIKDGRFITAPTDNLILPGIARAHLIIACRALGIPVEERAYTTDELMAADEVIVSSTSKFALRCTAIDGKEVGGRDAELFFKIQKYVLDEFDAYFK